MGNSIEKETTGTILANQIRMERSNHSGSFLLVEGSSDSKLFGKFINEHDCSITVCLGKENLIDALHILSNENFRGVLGFADKDLLSEGSLTEICENLIHTDENDLELMILCSQSFHNFLKEYGHGKKIREVTESSKISAIDLIFDAAAKVGGLRVLSHKEELALKFQDMKYHFVSNTEFDIDIDKQFEHVFARSKHNTTHDKDKILRQLKKLDDGTECSRNICCGHDCVRVLGRAIRRKFGKENKFDSEDGAKELEKILRLSYEYAFFQKTDSYKKFRDWEMESGFTVLRSED